MLFVVFVVKTFFGPFYFGTRETGFGHFVFGTSRWGGLLYLISRDFDVLALKSENSETVLVKLVGGGLLYLTSRHFNVLTLKSEFFKSVLVKLVGAGSCI